MHACVYVYMRQAVDRIRAWNDSTDLKVEHKRESQLILHLDESL